MNLRVHDGAFVVPSAEARNLPATGWARVLVVLGTGAAVFLAQVVAIQLWIPPAQLSTVWLQGGLLLAVVVLTEPSRWAGILGAGALGQAAALTTQGSVPPHASLILGILTALTTLTAAGVLRRILGGQLTLASLREFLVYLGVVVLGGAVAASLLLLAAAWGLGVRPASFQVWRTFGLAAVLGYLTVTPTIVLLVREADRVKRDSAQRRVEAGVLALVLVLLSGVVFTDATSRALAWPAFAVTFPPLLIWAAVRFYALGASGSLLLVTLISTLSTVRGLGPFVSNSADANTLSLQLFILGTGLPLLALAVVLGEQRRTLTALESTQTKLQGLNRDLIAAREEEATRIARELHDDVGQRLALVAIGLSRLRRAVSDSEQAPLGDIVRLQEQTGTAARTLRELSHQLHPTALEHAGLAVALEMQCEEVRQVTGLDVRLIHDDTLPAVPHDIALSLYRVAQEAITNAVRHSGAKVIRVDLRQEGPVLLLSVRDDGRGFVPQLAGEGRGLGLHSATERVRVHGGRLAIESRPGKGTVLRALVPSHPTNHA